MLTVAPILSALMLHSLNWISVKVNETEIIACRDKGQVIALRYWIDVGAVRSHRVDTLDWPAQFACLRCPGYYRSVASSTFILIPSLHVEEKQLIGSANRTDVISS